MKNVGEVSQVSGIAVLGAASLIAHVVWPSPAAQRACAASFVTRLSLTATCVMKHVSRALH